MDYNEELIGAIGDAQTLTFEDLRGKLATGPGDWGLRDPAKLQGLVLHQSLSDGSIESVARYHAGSNSHLKKGGAPSIAYALGIDDGGRVCLLNDLEARPWSQGYKDRPGDENAQFLSLMFTGYFRGPGVDNAGAGEPTFAQLRSLMGLWEVLKPIWGWQNDCLWGHYHFGKPACPGTTFQAVIEAIREDVPPTLVSVAAASYDWSSLKDRQNALNQLGHDVGAPDGRWGPNSRAGLTVFQAKAGLSADGLWGPKTKVAIIAALSEL